MRFRSIFPAQILIYPLRPMPFPCVLRARSAHRDARAALRIAPQAPDALPVERDAQAARGFHLFACKCGSSSQIDLKRGLFASASAPSALVRNFSV